jgi:hypothetical protein
VFAFLPRERSIAASSAKTPALKRKRLHAIVDIRRARNKGLTKAPQIVSNPKLKRANRRSFRFTIHPIYPDAIPAGTFEKRIPR